MHGASVWAGRLPPAITFGDDGSSEKNDPRLWAMIPVAGSMIPAPKAWNRLWISETAFP